MMVGVQEEGCFILTGKDKKMGRHRGGLQKQNRPRMGSGRVLVMELVGLGRLDS